MLSFGSAAFLPDKTLLGTFSANLETLPGAGQDIDTMKWWSKRPEAWAACRKDLRVPEVTLPEYKAWVEKLPGTPVFVAYPGAYDFAFVYWYLRRFTNGSPFSFSCLDMKTMAMVLMKSDFRAATKKNMPRKWFTTKKHRHVALDDAIEQGELFCNMLAEARRA